jgi:Alkylmercury lyase
MANPFSADPTPYRVSADGRDWYANCAWDAFGIGAALHVGSHISTECSDCGDAIEVDVVDGGCSDESLVFHCLVPAAQWWDDIVFT